MVLRSVFTSGRPKEGSLLALFSQLASEEVGGRDRNSGVDEVKRELIKDLVYDQTFINSLCVQMRHNAKK